MELTVKIRMNQKLFVKDPESTELGKKIIKESIYLIHKLGFEQFTFRKLADRIGSTEPAIYKYFENKHRLLVYIVTWYWTLSEYLIIIDTNGIKDPSEKLNRVIQRLVLPANIQTAGVDYDAAALYEIVVSESTKIYLTKDVANHNKEKIFKPYKDLCARIGGLIKEINPDYPYPLSLSSTLLEMAHMQHFFSENLPSLTDFGNEKSSEKLHDFLHLLVFNNLNSPAKAASGKKSSAKKSK